MTPMPPTANAAEILQGLWEETLEPADLTRRSLELGKLSSQLLATSQDGHVASVQLLNYGQGDLAEVISSSWVRYFAQVGIVAGQVGEASACLSGWATTLGAMLQAMAGVVAQAEAMIKLFENARPIMESFGIDVDAEIQAIKEAAQEDVRAISAAATGGLAAIPSWAGQIPAGLSMPGGQGAPTPTGVDNAPGTPAGQSTTSTTGVDQPPGTAAAAPASNTTGIDNAPGTAAATPAGNASGGGGGIDNAPGTSAPGASTSPGGMSPSSGSSPVSGSPTNPSASPSAGSSTPSAAASGGAGGSPTPASSGGSPSQSGGTSSPAGSGSSSSPSPAAAPTHSAAPESAPVSTASSHTSGGAAPAAATPLSPAAGVAPVSSVATPAAAAAGAPTSAGLPPVSAAASPIASAAAGAVPAPPAPSPVTPVSPLSPVSPGSALAPPPVSAPPPAPVHAPAVSGPAPGAPPPPPAAPNPGSSAPSAAASPHAPTASPVSQASGQQDGPADRGSASPIVPLSSAHDPLIAPAAFVTPPIVFTPTADNEDLAAVRITVEAVGGGDHVQWAAGMVAVSGSKKLVVTSDRGRGWMPSNAVLPASVELPWRHPDATRWEGLIDPARVIVEYAAAVGGTLTALASTMFSPPSVVSNVPFAFVDSTERAHPELLTSPILRGPTATRLELQISAGLRKKANVFTTDIEQRQQALGCANAAHLDAERLSGVVWRSDTRRRLFDVLRERQTVAPARIVELRPLWDELKDEWLTLRDLEHAARLDVRDVAIGQLDNSGSDCLPYLVQGYATEAALGLFTASSAVAFSHALYHWGMLRDYVAAADVVSS